MEQLAACMISGNVAMRIAALANVAYHSSFIRTSWLKLGNRPERTKRYGFIGERRRPPRCASSREP